MSAHIFTPKENVIRLPARRYMYIPPITRSARTIILLEHSSGEREREDALNWALVIKEWRVIYCRDILCTPAETALFCHWIKACEAWPSESSSVAAVSRYNSAYKLYGHSRIRCVATDVSLFFAISFVNLAPGRLLLSLILSLFGLPFKFSINSAVGGRIGIKTRKLLY